MLGCSTVEGRRKVIGGTFVEEKFDMLAVSETKSKWNGRLNICVCVCVCVCVRVRACGRAWVCGRAGASARVCACVHEVVGVKGM